MSFWALKVLITNNITQFDNHKMRERCQRLHINHRFFLVSHPQINGQIELTNKILLNRLK